MKRGRARWMWRGAFALVALVGCEAWWPCPDRVPAAGQPCEFHPGGAGDECEYGGNEHGLCRTFATCGETSANESSPHWIIDRPSATCGMNAAICPAAFGAMEGSACQPAVADCSYDEGLCGCESCVSQDGTAGSYWHCRRWTDVAPGCPVPPPRIGEGCDHEGLYCDYGPCCHGPYLGGDLRCKDGIWQPFPNTACICNQPQCP